SLRTSGIDRRPSSHGEPLPHRVVTGTVRSFHRAGQQRTVSSVPWHRNATAPDRGGTRAVVPSRSSHPQRGQRSPRQRIRPGRGSVVASEDRQPTERRRGESPMAYDTTMLDLVNTVTRYARSEAEVIATVVFLVNSG